MRALAREVAFKKIYESIFTENQDDLQSFFDIDNLTKDEDKDFATTLVTLYFENKSSIEEMISAKLIDYSLDRMYKIDRAIVSVAITEMFYYKKTALSIVINEAVELAKKYGTEKSYSFVNGVLKSICEANK